MSSLWVQETGFSLAKQKAKSKKREKAKSGRTSPLQIEGKMVKVAGVFLFGTIAWTAAAVVPGPVLRGMKGERRRRLDYPSSCSDLHKFCPNSADTDALRKALELLQLAGVKSVSLQQPQVCAPDMKADLLADGMLAKGLAKATDSAKSTNDEVFSLTKSGTELGIAILAGSLGGPLASFATNMGLKIFHSVTDAAECTTEECAWNKISSYVSKYVNYELVDFTGSLQQDALKGYQNILNNMQAFTSNRTGR